jgi:hypothetical protein
MSLSLTFDTDSHVQEDFLARGWTDGLPIVPPTPERVQAMLELVSAQNEPELLIGFVPARGVGVSFEKAAINAVMAGCTPEYFPVVVGALEALFDTAYNVHASLSSTGGSAICAIVSGPLAAEIGMGARHNVLGQGNTANATIGRALRLVAVNVLGARPGEADASSFGHPGKFTFCFAEDPPPSPWQPLQVQLGYGVEDTIVTVLPSLAPSRISQMLTNSSERVLRTVASEIRSPAHFYQGGGKQGVVVLGPEHAGFCVADGWTQAEVREFLVRESRISAEELVRSGIYTDEIDGLVAGEDGCFAGIQSQNDLLLLTAGGEGAGFSVWIPGHSWVTPTVPARRASRRIRPAGEALPDCGPDGCVVPWMRT